MKKLQEMTLQEKIGQVLAIGFKATTVDEHLQFLIEEKSLGNVILFSRNIESIQQLHDLNWTIHEKINKKTGILPFISIDQEGGMVTRIMKEATFCPGNMTLCATKPEYAYQVGTLMGKELAALGINMNFAPSLDVNNNPNNPVIGVRSYSDRPEVVTQYGNLFIKGLQEQGIFATAKHFPGHGDTSVDSHLGLPTVPHGKKRLQEVELYPFIKAIEAGVWAIMSAHVFFTAYETNELPATLSKNVMTDLLRYELGFEGILVSDCMEMKAIDDTYGAAKGALMGLLAGLDIALISQTKEKQLEAFHLIEEAVNNGSFPMKLLDEKVERILKYKEKSRVVLEEAFFQKSLDAKREVVLDNTHKELAKKIVDESFTKVKGKMYYPAKHTLVIAPSPFATTIAEDELNVRSIIDQLKTAKIAVDTRKISVNPTDEEINQLLLEAKNYEQVVICTYNAVHFKNQGRLVRKLHDVVCDLFVLSTRNPYDYLMFTEVKNYYCFYEYTPNSVQSIVKFLQGSLMPTGTLPVSLETPMEIGASLYVGLEEYPLQKNIEYLTMLHQEGIEKIFISAHMPEMKNDFVLELEKLIEVALQLNMKVIVDVSKPMMKKWSPKGIYALRLDWGFSIEDTMDLYQEHDFYIELNASTITENQLRMLKARGMDFSRIRVSHNFYPKPLTGLSVHAVRAKNEFLHKHGFRVMGYIPSQTAKRPPIFEGLPTLERHRTMPISYALREMKALGFNEVIFGDAFASVEEIREAIQVDYRIWEIPIRINKNLSAMEQDILSRVHRFRIDESPYLRRSSIRVIDQIKPNNTVVRSVGDVTIDNFGFGRYQGEVSIILTEAPADSRVNVVGSIVVDVDYIRNIKPKDRFVFRIVGNQGWKK